MIPGRLLSRTALPVRRAAVVLAFACGACGFFPITRTSGVNAEVLELALKPPPVDSVFDGCGPDGSQPDYALNRRKNRVDEADYLPVPWSLVARLPWPRAVGYRFRNQWSSGETQEVARYEGAAIQVEGYLADYRLEIPEPPNCYAREAADRDFHMWLSKRPHQSKRHSIVVEITPRLRARHAGWTADRLAALVASQRRVRLGGWLMLDQMHPESIGGTRITLWEVHPIMRFEWQRPDGSWVPLDSLSPASTRSSR